MSKTLIILNPHAGGGRSGQLWRKLEPLLWESLGELVIAVTENPEEVAHHLDKAYAAGLTRVISIGGDGTNHALVNAIVALNQHNPDGPPVIYGNVPVGTGRDWARGIGMTFKPEIAARWIAFAQPRPTDIGQLDFDGQRQHFLNIASAGLSGEVDRRVNLARVRRPWTFLQATVSTLLTHRAQRMRVELDGQSWYEGPAYLVAVANGTTFGHGMKIAPTAQVNDGLFDVVLVEGMPRADVLLALRKVYNATHLVHPGVHFQRARQVHITGLKGRIGLDMDGENASGESLTFTVRPGLLQLLS
ncbi:MAG: diacylglycerol kinase family lipid kinase [Anaerolineae bacterium]|nr:diacylglycerol kinase family lipid kinase [Anaerolineae bacterium]